MTTLEIHISDGLANEIEFARRWVGNQSRERFARCAIEYCLHVMRDTGQLPESADEGVDWLL
jgi:hypothetical protein